MRDNMLIRLLGDYYNIYIWYL